MGKVEFHAIQCADCGLYQVQQVKKNPQFKCTVCKKQQKLLNEHFRGPANKCREIVQRLNRARHEGEIPFKPISVDSSMSASEPSTKRKSTSTTGENHSKRLKDADSDGISGTGASELVQMSDDEDDLFPPETTKETPSRALSDLSIQRTHRDNNDEPVETLFSGVKVKSARHVDDDDDDDIFDDIPSPPRTQEEGVVKNQDASRSNFPESSTDRFVQPFQQNGRICVEEVPTGDKNCYKVPAEEEGEEPDSGTSVMVSRTTRKETAGKHPEKLERVVDCEKRASIAETGKKGATAIQEGWRRRSLSKLAKFKFDAEDDSNSMQTSIMPIPNALSHNTPIPPSEGSLPEAGRSHEKSEQCHTQATASENSTKTAKRSEDATRESVSASEPEVGRGRLLATLEKFRRAPSAKHKAK